MRGFVIKKQEEGDLCEGDEDQGACCARRLRESGVARKERRSRGGGGVVVRKREQEGGGVSRAFFGKWFTKKIWRKPFSKF
jgi:hypothetical protein